MVPINNIPVDPSDWTQVFSACLGQSIAVQTACGELVVKNSRWNIDLSRGIITFGRHGLFPRAVHRLGIECEQHVDVGLE